LTVEAGDGAATSDLDFTSLSPSDLPKASVTGTNSDITIKVARRASANEEIIDDILKITNNGDVDEDVGISYTGYPTGENYFTDTYSGTDGSSDLDKKDTQQIFQFKTAPEGTRVSPDPTKDSDEYANTIEIKQGGSTQLDLVTDLTGNQVKKVIDVDGDPGNPFGGGNTTEGVELLNVIKIGTTGTNNPQS
jgi:hypothetical protein